MQQIFAYPKAKSQRGILALPSNSIVERNIGYNLKNDYDVDTYKREEEVSQFFLRICKLNIGELRGLAFRARDHAPSFQGI